MGITEVISYLEMAKQSVKFSYDDTEEGEPILDNIFLALTIAQGWGLEKAQQEIEKVREGQNE